MHPKQIVFLFMIGTVMFVAAFLLGVSVGRDGAARAGHQWWIDTEPSAKPIRNTGSAPQASAGVASSPRSASEEDLSYFGMLLGNAVSPEPSFPEAPAKD